MTLSNSASESINSHFKDGVLNRFSKGKMLVEGDQEPAGVYLIKSGFVKAYSYSRLGQRNLLLIHGINELMPLPWALDGAQKIGVMYEAMSAVTVLNVSKDSLRSAMGHDNWLTEQILGQLVNTFTVYAQRIQSLGYRLPKERVIACVLDLATRFGISTKEGIIIQAPITHQDIADSVSVTRETASRVLGVLFGDGLLTQKQHLFVVIDERRLKAELH